jgi:hypothetical protein
LRRLRVQNWHGGDPPSGTLSSTCEAHSLHLDRPDTCFFSKRIDYEEALTEK